MINPQGEERLKQQNTREKSIAPLSMLNGVLLSMRGK